MAGGVAFSGTYSPTTGFVFLFNLIVGAGALTIPHAFAQVGLVYGLLALFLLSLVSYISATFVVESIAGINALHSINASTAVTQGSVTILRALKTKRNETQADPSSAEAVPFLVQTEVHRTYLVRYKYFLK
jgi:hypothetical protein